VAGGWNWDRDRDWGLGNCQSGLTAWPWGRDTSWRQGKGSNDDSTPQVHRNTISKRENTHILDNCSSGGVLQLSSDVLRAVWLGGCPSLMMPLGWVSPKNRPFRQQHRQPWWWPWAWQSSFPNASAPSMPTRDSSSLVPIKGLRPPC
jgi:hypothetical protein